LPEPITIDDIRAAASRVSGAVLHSPCHHSRTLSQITGAEVFIKFENLQFTASFKERGAINRLVTLPQDSQQNGVIAISAGNHAQGVAYHAERLGIDATIVMPANTPFVKVQQTRAFGAKVVLTGETIAECKPEADRIAREQGLAFIHPFDDEAIIAGQGTLGLEIAEDAPSAEVVVMPIGGGGLISGVAIALQAVLPSAEVIGVESERYASTSDTLANRSREYGGQTVAEGIAVKAPGDITLPIIRDRVSDVLVADESAIERAISLYFNVEKTVAEGAGAASLAALLANPERFRGKRVVVVLSGGNIDSRLMATVIMRSLVHDGQIARIRVHAADIPGQLADVARVIAENQANIVEVEHQRLFADVALKSADIDITVETREREYVGEIKAALNAAGFVVSELGFETSRSG